MPVDAEIKAMRRLENQKMLSTVADVLGRGESENAGTAEVTDPDDMVRLLSCMEICRRISDSGVGSPNNNVKDRAMKPVTTAEKIPA